MSVEGIPVLQVPRKGRGKRKRAQSAADHLPNGLSWPHVSLLQKNTPPDQVKAVQLAPNLQWPACCQACLCQRCPKPVAAKPAARAHNRLPQDSHKDHTVHLPPSMGHRRRQHIKRLSEQQVSVYRVTLVHLETQCLRLHVQRLPCQSAALA